MTQKCLSRKERQRLSHKAEILDAALNLFSDKGFHNVSMQEIASEAEFATGTLYNFFESKEALFSELMNNCVSKVVGQLIGVLDSHGDQVEAVRAYIGAHKEIIEDNAATIKLYLSQRGNQSLSTHSQIDDEIRGRDEKLRHKLEGFFRTGAKKGVFRQVNAHVTTLLLCAMLEAFAFAVIRTPELVTIEEGLRDIERLFFDGLLVQVD